jgi:hypothetical protein
VVVILLDVYTNGHERKIPEAPNEVINKDEETRDIWKG